MSWPVEKMGTSKESRAEFLADRKRRRLASGSPPKGFMEDEGLLRAVIEHPDDDAPRWAYATWMRQQVDPDAVVIGEFVESQLRIAEAYRADPRADVRALRRFPPYGMLFDIEQLVADGLVAWPGYLRGFVEDVAVRASRLMEIGDELFGVAPVRHLSIVDVASAVDELAAWPGLARIRSLYFPVFEPERDLLTDAVLARLVASRYLTNIAVILLDADQTRLTHQGYKAVVTAPTLPRLSYFDIKFPPTLTCWAEPVVVKAEPGTLRYFDHVIQNPPKDGDLRWTPKSVILRPEDWIVELEREVGYMPCLHPEEHYGGYMISFEAPVEHPIALDPAIMARRGTPVPDLGPKPSLMQRREQGLCAICGSSELTFEHGQGDPYGDPDGRYGGTWTCDRCGTCWYADQWPEKS